MKPNWFYLAPCLVLFLSLPPPCQAQTTMEHLGPSVNAAFRLSGSGKILRGTLGQPMIGVVSDTSYAAHVGFWHLFRMQAVVGLDDPPAVAPRFQLSQNHPNPFRSLTTIRFALGEQSRAKLRVFDVQGRAVATLIDKELPPAEYTLTFHPTELPSGIYWYRLEAGNFVEQKKLILLK